MKEWIRLWMERATRAAGLMVALVLLTEFMVVFLMWWNGALAPDRLRAAVQGLRGAKAPGGGGDSGIPAHEWERLQRTRDQQAEELARRERVLENLRDMKSLWQEQVRRDRATLEASRMTLEQDRRTFEEDRKIEIASRKSSDTTFEENVRRFEETPAKTTAWLLFSLSDGEIARYLKAMNPGSVADVFRAMQRMDEYSKPDPADPKKPARIEEIMKEMQRSS